MTSTEKSPDTNSVPHKVAGEPAEKNDLLSIDCHIYISAKYLSEFAQSIGLAADTFEHSDGVLWLKMDKDAKFFIRCAIMYPDTSLLFIVVPNEWKERDRKKIFPNLKEAVEYIKENS